MAAAAVLGVRAACKSCVQEWEAYNMLMLIVGVAVDDVLWGGGGCSCVGRACCMQVLRARVGSIERC